MANQIKMNDRRSAIVQEPAGDLGGTRRGGHISDHVAPTGFTEVGHARVSEELDENYGFDQDVMSTGAEESALESEGIMSRVGRGFPWAVGTVILMLAGGWAGYRLLRERGLLSRARPASRPPLVTPQHKPAIGTLRFWNANLDSRESGMAA